MYNESYLCSAVIMSDSKLLTSASCIVGKVPEEKRKDVQALVGISGTIVKNGLPIPGFDINIHPHYDGRAFNIAILVLSDHVLKFGKRIRTSHFAWDGYLMKRGKKDTAIAGFINNNGVYSLVGLKMPIIKRTDCVEIYKKHNKVLPKDAQCGIGNKELTSICKTDNSGSY